VDEIRAWGQLGPRLLVLIMVFCARHTDDFDDTPPIGAQNTMINFKEKGRARLAAFAVAS
jgi:hypothetical protein